MSTVDMTAEHEFVVYAEGLCYASVCTRLSDEAAADRLNTERPAGTGLGWRLTDGPFRDGSPNGRPCDQVSSRRHLLFEC